MRLRVSLTLARNVCCGEVGLRGIKYTPFRIAKFNGDTDVALGLIPIPKWEITNSYLTFGT